MSIVMISKSLVYEAAAAGGRTPRDRSLVAFPQTWTQSTRCLRRGYAKSLFQVPML